MKVCGTRNEKRAKFAHSLVRTSGNCIVAPAEWDVNGTSLICQIEALFSIDVPHFTGYNELVPQHIRISE